MIADTEAESVRGRCPQLKSPDQHAVWTTDTTQQNAVSLSFLPIWVKVCPRDTGGEVPRGLNSVTLPRVCTHLGWQGIPNRRGHKFAGRSFARPALVTLEGLRMLWGAFRGGNPVGVGNPEKRPKKPACGKRRIDLPSG